MYVPVMNLCFGLCAVVLFVLALWVITEMVPEILDNIREIWHR